MSTSRPAGNSPRQRLLRPLALSLLFLSVLASAAAQEEHRLSIDQMIVSEDGDQITALVSVLDPAGQPVLGLTAFATAIGGASIAPISIQPVVSEETGIAVLLLIDVSGSMEGEPLAQAQAAADTFVRGLLPQDVAALATFAGDAPGPVAFTSDRAGLLDDIARLEAEPETGTALYDTIVRGLAEATAAPTARRAVVLLTDGQDQGGVSGASRAEALNAASDAGLPIYAIGLGPGADVALLQTLAEQAGGAFYQAPSPEDVPTIFDAIGAGLRSQYALTLPVPDVGGGQELLVRIDLQETTLSARTTFQARDATVVIDDEGGRQPVWLVPGAIGAAALVVAAAGLWSVRRRRRRGAVLAGGPGQDISLAPRSPDRPEPVSVASGRLTIVAGPNAGVAIRLTSEPVDLGSHADSALQLDTADSSVAGTHARVWLQGERLMVHHLAPGRQTLVGGKPIEWATLDPEDTLRIGPHVIAFAMETSRSDT